MHVSNYLLYFIFKWYRRFKIYEKDKTQIVKITMSFMFIFTIYSVSVSASVVSTPEYIVKSNSAIFYGGYYYNPYGQNNLHSGYTENGNKGMMTNEMWIMFDEANNYWIETGDMDGKFMDGSYWAGHFMAICTGNITSSYSEYKFGSQYAGSGNSFEVLKTASSEYTVYCNDTAQKTFYMPYSIISYMDVGIETDSNTSYFTNGMYNNNLKYLDTNHTWQNWAITKNKDNNTFGWWSTYNASNNTITYSR